MDRTDHVTKGSSKVDTGGAAGAVAEGSAIALPKGGGAIAGIGETFSADAQSGTGHFTVPIALPPGRNGLTPNLSLSYSTGNGNGPFGLGWALCLPGVSRKTSRGVPSYIDGDTFLLSGSEDLIPLSGTDTSRVRYRPRTEGEFARIEHVREGATDFWEVRSTHGGLTRYSEVTARPGGGIFAWYVTRTVDALGNQIRYSYRRDQGRQDGHTWDQPLLERVEYADYGDRAAPSFLVGVEFLYEPRPDAFSDYRAGFEIRTSLRCKLIRVYTRTSDGAVHSVREYRLGYRTAAFNGVSLLTRIDVVGIGEMDGGIQLPPGDNETLVFSLTSTPVPDPPEEPLPPLTFTYAEFDPRGRRFAPVTGDGLPPRFGDPDLAMVDLRGSGLPDLVELGGAARYWSNRGGGAFDLPRPITGAPPHALSDEGVLMLDADGDGRTDLLAGGGYFPLTFGAAFRSVGSGGSFRAYRQMPSVDLADPAVRLIDLDGDGLTDVLRSGARLECWFNDRDPDRAWRRQVLVNGPNVDLADPHVRLADMTGDGLQDIVLLRSGNISYWPNLGHGRWGAPVRMRQSPRLPHDFDPRRVLLGDADGDGAADLWYVDSRRILLWGNRSGNGWTAGPTIIAGTPRVVDTDDVQLMDLYGTGMGGLLWSRADDGQARFLDVCGGVKPYLLSTMDNHRGARTTVHYRSSIDDYLRDGSWRTTLPFPAHVVARVEVEDLISSSRMVTEYRYHHGYWDGLEREFRGFAMVEQLDTEVFDPAGVHYSPPTLLKTWFHVGPVAAIEAGDWVELDLSDEYWAGDAPRLTRPAAFTAFLHGLDRQGRRDALRAMRGRPLRTELYALDGTQRQDRPYTVTEALTGVREEGPPAPAEDGRPRVFFPFAMASRTTQWERGEEPMTRFSFSAGYDAYGLPTKEISVAVPQGAGEPYLATLATTEYAQRDDAQLFMVDRVARTTVHEVLNDGTMSPFELRQMALAGTAQLRVIGHSRTFYDGPEFVGLPLGQLGAYGLPVRSESLALTDGLLAELGLELPYLNSRDLGWPAAYPQEFQDLTPQIAGYAYYGEDQVPGSPGGYYVASARMRYDAHDPALIPRGLPLAVRDPLGTETRTEYDIYGLLPVRSIDPLGLRTEAVNDYRVLRPQQVTDANGNTASTTFSPAGFVVETFARGKGGRGDAVLPSVRLEYDLHAFASRQQPVSVRTIRRVHHDTATDVPAGQRDDVIVSVEYSDGFGRPLQTRAQAEDTLFGDVVFGGGVLPVDQSSPAPIPAGRTRNPANPPNVVVSGWQVYDNKGRVVHKYEPFFGTGFGYAAPVEAHLGRKAVMFYDPRGQVVRTVSPDGSEQRVILGVPEDLADPESFVPTPWEAYTYDANDNAGRTHGTAAQAFAGHWDTPSSVGFDALGRVIFSVARNGDQHLSTVSTYDIQGNLTSITDPSQRQAFRYRHDLLKRVWRSDSIDAGRRDVVHDALGRVVETRDSKGAMSLAAFDIVHRPSRAWARDGAAGPVTLRQRVEYGDGSDPNQPPAQRDAARAQNLLGRAVRHYDEAGLSAVTDVDFKGNVLESARWVIADAPILQTYAQAVSQGWRVAPFRVDWTLPVAQLLEPVAYLTSTRYDALNRVTRQMVPTDVESRRRELRPVYNRAGRLERVLLDDTVYVDRIAYDAKGQRTMAVYGNGVTTRYAYDPDTFRLARLRSERQGTVLQDQGYVYDLAGNILTIRDRTPGCGLPVTPHALDRQFAYDPVYRLLSATGRESDDPPHSPPWTVIPRHTDITRTRAYAETYTYDANNNLTGLGHVSAVGYTRSFALDAAGSRLRRMTVGTTPFDYTYDANGNMLSETASRHYTWDHSDRLSTFATQTAGAEPSVHAHYLYDATGQRIKKLVRRQGGTVEVTHYLGGFEHHRWGTGPAAQNNHLHVMDGQSRIAIVRVGPAGPGDQSPAVAFHLADHLGSSTVIVDGAGQVTNREEYTPYGETSFGSYTRKRYRFTGKERDEESGLNHHGARYCLPWLARWASCDPIGAKGGLNQYTYAACNPVAYHDPAGTNPKRSQQKDAEPSHADNRRSERGGEKLSQVRTEEQALGAISNFLQELADQFLEPALRRQPGEGASPFGTRMHDVLQGIVESGQFNAPKGVPARRVITEVIMTDDGRIHSFAGKPGGAPAGAVTVDIGILKPGLTNDDALVGMKAKDVLEAGIDYKTGDAKLAKRQQDFFKKIGTPLHKLTAYGNLESAMVGPDRARPRGSKRGWSGVALALLEIGLSVSVDAAARNSAPTVQDVLTEVALSVAATRVPAVGLVTASNHDETVLPILCIPLWKLCAVAGAGLAIGAGAFYAYDAIGDAAKDAGKAVDEGIKAGVDLYKFNTQGLNIPPGL